MGGARGKRRFGIEGKLVLGAGHPGMSQNDDGQGERGGEATHRAATFRTEPAPRETASDGRCQGKGSRARDVGPKGIGGCGAKQRTLRPPWAAQEPHGEHGSG
jgi:hypothetical protein